MSSMSRSPRRRVSVLRLLLIFLGIVVLGFVVIQLIPVPRTNPPVTSEPDWDSAETRALAKRACFDCHSNETRWPWYSYVAPVSWLVSRDITEGRERLNFSEWDAMRGEAREPEEIIEAILEGYMPPSNYVAMHPEADLTPAERDQLIQGLRATLR